MPETTRFHLTKHNSISNINSYFCITFYTQKIAEVHGANHPELLQIADLFTQIDIELRQHLKNEEEVLLKTLIIEGVMDIQAGHSAKVIEQKLYAQIPPETRKVSEE